MKFLCVPCDTPMKLQTVVPPDRGSLSVVYACPECGYEIAMLTNAYETQVVQSLGVRIGPDLGAEAAGTSGSNCPFAAMLPATDGASSGAARPGQHRARRLSGGLLRPKHGSRTFPRSCAPWHGPASRRSPASGGPAKWTRPSSTRPATSSGCDAG